MALCQSKKLISENKNNYLINIAFFFINVNINIINME